MTTERLAPTFAGGEWTVPDLRAGFDLQRKADHNSAPTGVALRKDRLTRLGLALAQNADALVTAIDGDFGHRPAAASLTGEIVTSLQDISAARRHLAKWMKPRRPQPGYLRLTGIKAWVEPRPLGVVGVIAPWNFPIALAVGPAVAAIAAGNRVMIKMSEVTPRTARVFQDAVAAHFSPEELVVVTGGPEIGAAFSSLPFDHILFTGSPAVGKAVQRAAAEHLTPVTLELGGKNPTVVGRDADLAEAAKRIVRARLANSGQICLSPDYVFVPRELESAFLTAAEDAARSAMPTVLGNENFCTIINDHHFQRLVALVEDARTAGATVTEVIPPGEALPDRASRRIPLTLISKVSPEMAVMQEEIFGPLLPVIPYSSIEEVIDFVGSRPAPLAAYWFGAGSKDFDEFSARSRSGGVTRNDFAMHAGLEGLPFGGVGNSGTGYYHGQYGFDTFSHLRAYAISPNAFSPAAMLSPPFSPRLAKAMRWFVDRQTKTLSKRLSRTSNPSPKASSRP